MGIPREVSLLGQTMEARMLRKMKRLDGDGTMGDKDGKWKMWKLG